MTRGPRFYIHHDEPDALDDCYGPYATFGEALALAREDVEEGGETHIFRTEPVSVRDCICSPTLLGELFVERFQEECNDPDYLYQLNVAVGQGTTSSGSTQTWAARSWRRSTACSRSTTSQRRTRPS